MAAEEGGNSVDNPRGIDSVRDVVEDGRMDAWTSRESEQSTISERALHLKGSSSR